MTVKNKNRWWHVRNSLWVVLALVPLVYWLPFFIIGKKVQNKKYRITGYVHLSIAICLAVGFFTAIGVACSMISMLHAIVEFVQCLLVREKYLIQLAEQEAKQQLEQTLGQRLPVEAAQPQPEAVADPLPERIPQQKLNVNSCTEEELCALPGISIVEAKRMTALRGDRGDFDTVEAFISAIGVKPHVAARIVDGLYAEPTAASTADKKPVHRVLDI